MSSKRPFRAIVRMKHMKMKRVMRNEDEEGKAESKYKYKH